ncbi:peptidoglycan-binding domain-containing protein [Neorhizobium sp. JUb45]|uniref:peptidoglycan-binding domain-containing protein n=1 Tax=Neorhizobium sp. JUb45 TaxID=2485113 RepID=UPI00104CA604|nr:peptidoglycan-binding domain-containing protein [Neorhizobium sp. JUb45]TCR02795.1 putative peptidoglycan binding protein [Neorhizobium sp. JUb45]
MGKIHSAKFLMASVVSFSLVTGQVFAETQAFAPAVAATDSAATAPAPVSAPAVAPAPDAMVQAPVPAAVTPPAAAASNDGWEQEFALWQAASSGNSVDEYNGYLAAYPAGKFAAIAKARIVKLVASETPAADEHNAPAEIAAPVEPAFSVGTPETEAVLLSQRATRREVQGRLTSLGFSTGGADGALGARSRNAIMQWQGFVDAPTTGYISYDQLARLRTDSEQPYQSWLASQPKPKPARVRARPAAGDELVGRVNDNSAADAAIALGVLGLAAGVIGGAAMSRGRHHGPRYYRGGGRPFRHHR